MLRMNFKLQGMRYTFKVEANLTSVEKYPKYKVQHCSYLE